TRRPWPPHRARCAIAWPSSSARRRRPPRAGPDRLMRGTLTIVRRELLGYFRSPIGYVFLVVFVLLAVGLPWFLDGFLDSDEAGLAPFFRYLPWINVLFVPAVGMRLWAEEKHTGTWELLLTLP